jgi:hypothetical protein
MTNFEKWKRDLTIEKMVEIFGGDVCHECPVKYQGCGKYDSCTEDILEWANKEIEEDAM